MNAKKKEELRIPILLCIEAARLGISGIVLLILANRLALVRRHDNASVRRAIALLLLADGVLRVRTRDAGGSLSDA